MKDLTFAAIDMGTNATRVAIGIDSPENGLEIIHTHRYPLRFGMEVFCNGNITSNLIEDSVGIFSNIKKTLATRNVTKIRAVATSALREAKNSRTLIERIRKETGIVIEVISGLEEAHLLSWAICQKLDLSSGTHMIADLGAGSLELIRIRNSKPVWLESFTISAVAYAGMDNNILETIIPPQLEESLAGAREQFKGLDSFIASGGNIEVLGRLLESSSDEHGVRAISTFSLDVFIKQCKRMTIEEIRYYFGLPIERAEVIGSSAQIYRWLAGKIGIDAITIPMIGLKEAVLMDMVECLRQSEIT